FKPGEAVRLEALADADCIRNAEPGMSLHGQVDLGAYGFPHGRHNVNGQILFPSRQRTPPRAKGIKLQCSVSQPYSLPGRIRKGLRRALAAVPTVGVSPNALVTDSSQQIIDGLIEGFANGVPASNLQC